MHNFLIYLIIGSFCQPQYVLLSFDTEIVDTPDEINLILNSLDNYNASSTFFITGQFAETYPLLVREIFNSHEVACHSYSHPDLTKLSLDEKELELIRCVEILYNITGEYPSGFRAPYNKIDSETFSLLKQHGFLYDSSMFDKFYFSQKGIEEIPISTSFFIPLEDVIWLYYLGIDNYYFSILKYHKKPIASFLFHPHHIAKEIEGFESVLQYYNNQNIKFITHEQYYYLK